MCRHCYQRKKEMDFHNDNGVEEKKRLNGIHADEFFRRFFVFFFAAQLKVFILSSRR